MNKLLGANYWLKFAKETKKISNSTWKYLVFCRKGIKIAFLQDCRERYMKSGGASF